MFLKSVFSKFFTPKYSGEAPGFIDKNPEYIFVDNKKAFNKMIKILDNAPSCTMDTEADSMYHYEEKLSLIQISFGKYHWLVDPLCNLNIKALWKCNAMKNITLHACDYDLRLLAMFYKFYPEHIYDTSIAAKLLGEKQTGLAALVEKYFKVALDKDNQKADWTKRPLSEKMCNYAVADTVYLDALREMQIKKLKELGRLDWLRESCVETLKNSKRILAEQKENPKEAWRLKGSNVFKPHELQLLRAAWYWRDAEAKRRDCASYRVLNPYFMMDLVRIAAKIKGKITEHNLPKLPRNIKGNLLQSFLKELNAAAIAPAKDYPQPIKRKASPRTAINDDLREKLRELRNEKAAELKIDSGLLAKQSQLSMLSDALLGDWESKFKAAEFMNWQIEIWRVLVQRAVLPATAQEFRQWAHDKISAMGKEAREKESEELYFELSKHSTLENGMIAAFYPMKSEPKIIPFLKKLAGEGRLLLPRIINEKNMEFVSVKNIDRDLQKGSLGIMEPKPDLQACSENPVAFLVPGVVFGKDGSRIGHGAGYYDRYLASFKNIPRLGIAYSAQIRSSLPQNATDIRMDEVIFAKL